MSKNIFERMGEAQRDSRQVIDSLRAIGMGAEIAQYAKLDEKMFWQDPKEPEAINIQRKLVELQHSLTELDKNSDISDEEKRSRH